jgi:hypothetical protein
MEHNTKNSIIYTNKMFLTEPVFYMIINAEMNSRPVRPRMQINGLPLIWWAVLRYRVVGQLFL